jgi:hypothetical protein
MRTQHLRCSWALPNDSKYNKASFSTTSTDWLYLRVAQMPRCSDLAFFVVTDVMCINSMRLATNSYNIFVRIHTIICVT